MKVKGKFHPEANEICLDVMRLVILMLICWLVLDYYYSCEMLAVVCHADITGGHCSISYNGV